MADFPVYEGSIYTAVGVNTSDSGGVALTSGAIHTKGEWAEITSAAPNGITGFFVQIHNPSTHARNLIDIGIGAAGSEVVLVPNLRQYSRQSHGGNKFWLPMAIPAGVRVAARLQSGAASQTCDVSLGVVRGGGLASPPLTLATHYGVVTASTTGTEIDPGATPNTKGTAVEITSSCSQIRSLIINLGQGTTCSTEYHRENYNFLLDIGIGASGSEVYILSNIQFVSNSTSDLVTPAVIGPIDCYIPAGTRIVARAQSQEIRTKYREFDISLLGLN